MLVARSSLPDSRFLSQAVILPDPPQNGSRGRGGEGVADRLASWGGEGSPGADAGNVCGLGRRAGRYVELVRLEQPGIQFPSRHPQVQRVAASVGRHLVYIMGEALVEESGWPNRTQTRTFPAVNDSARGSGQVAVQSQALSPQTSMATGALEVLDYVNCMRHLAIPAHHWQNSAKSKSMPALSGVHRICIYIPPVLVTRDFLIASKIKNRNLLTSSVTSYIMM